VEKGIDGACVLGSCLLIEFIYLEPTTNDFRRYLTYSIWEIGADKWEETEKPQLLRISCAYEIFSQ